VKTPAEIFAEIDQRLRTQPEKTRGLRPARYHIRVDSYGGLVEDYHLFLGRTSGAGKGLLPPGAAADCSITMDAQTLAGIADGTVNPVKAFMSGRVGVAGQMYLVPQLGKALR
jgi:hypothetical protein